MERLTAALEIEIRPAWPYRLPRRGSGDGTMRARDGILSRLLNVGGEPVVVHAWRRRSGEVVFRARGGVPRESQELAIERMRFALGVDDDYSELFARFKRDPVIGPALRRRPWLRPRRQPWPWEAFAWAITGQLIEASRAREIQRRIVRRWGPRVEHTGVVGQSGWLRDVPGPEVIAGRAPAELAGMDLAGGRAIAMVRAAREVAAGRADLDDPAADRRLLAIRGIGPWTMQCLGLLGRGDPDSLPAGDLAYVKLVGRLAGLRRRATVEEIEEYFEPYAPYRGLAGAFAVAHYHLGVQAGPPLRLAA
jgi:3-methyladenine DNA glycosylase/8-oxoguanine DNA glycosylase